MSGQMVITTEMIYMAAKQSNESFLENHREYIDVRQEMVEKIDGIFIQEQSTALHICAWKGNLTALTLLLKHGADPNVVNKLEERPIHYASIQGSLSCVKELRSHDASISPVNQQGQTPLHEASRLGNDSIVLWLLGHGAVVNHQDDYGDTALHVAACHSCQESVQILLDKGADPSICNQRTLTPLAIAKKNKDRKLIKSLGGKPKGECWLF